MNNDDSPFPKRLKQARKDRGLSQKQLGILSGMDEFSASARMNQYEKGVHSPDFKTVKALAEVLKVPTAFLYCEEDDLAEQIASFKNG
ncbi:hypothetical protein KUL42_13370 [Alteromonas sp. KUL42]|uniref:helix-turn-helix domain-containing protein n=1 Tax=Alteromonas sp. KUL42 TaxID=2480797 RepID=UPI001035D17B|nr:helix-turn-helix transcriptional regulator [Alteromonas sp. KUL42]TAP37153.1 XRE family transcriptional regulator [Alteromonas sp. KUL42]GEA06576.1 hypothetical protein KUL42_13370 [Alteromonas sp. KUL42]